MQGRSWFRIVSLVIGFAFLYIPIVSLIVYSFNASKLVTVWGGFSTKWYGALLQNEQILNAAWLSLRVAAISATLAVVLGTLAGMVLARFGPFKGRTLFSGLTTAPLVMPEVITGLSLLLLFVTMEQLIGWPPGRGMTTIIISHVTFTMAFVTVLVQSRLVQMDESLEEAALDLGARPWKVFFLITLPIIFPALLSGWLLAFTLSLDDLVIASFVAGPGSTHAADGDLLEGPPRREPGHQRARDHPGDRRRDRRGGRRRHDDAAAEGAGPRCADGAGGQPADDREPEEGLSVAGGPILSFDVGGSFVKAGLVDVAAGPARRRGVAPRRRRPTRRPSAVMDLLASMARDLPSRGPVGSGVSGGREARRRLDRGQRRQALDRHRRAAHCSRRASADRWRSSTMRMPPAWRR